MRHSDDPDGFSSLYPLPQHSYGEQGPKSQQKAYDLLVQAESGMCAVTGMALVSK